jgi:hypothetical protein
MGDPQHKYTVTTPHGDVNLTTSSHHSDHDTIEDFLTAHKGKVAAALGLGSLALQGLGLYLSHGRSGPKLH